jgi:purine nucleoside permease
VADNVLGLLFEINADPSKAEAALKNFNASTGSALQKASEQNAKFNKDTEKGLLDAKQSVRLLASEFGIHLPRAVSGAIAEILPNIATLGSAMLAAFAVQEVIRFAGGSKERPIRTRANRPFEHSDCRWRSAGGPTSK